MTLPTRSRRPTDPRVDGDRGAVIAEFALILPFLMVITMGLLEFGNGYRSRLSLESTISSAGRTGAQMGTARFTDFEILRSVSSGVSAIRGATVQRVVVWRATTGATGPRCVTGASVTGVCNVYNAAQVADASGAGFSGGTSTSPSCGPGSWDLAWCPLDRSDETGAQDYIGVYAQVQYPSLSRFFSGATMTTSAWTVYRIEPPIGVS